jgi:ATP-binding protein involved in chromosome partitioning
LVAAAKTVAGVDNVSVNMQTRVIAHAVQRGVQLLPSVKNIIAVASGKGGVGKSTTTVNLALALAAEGARVGILDADIYGPSQPMMMGIEGRPESTDGQTMEPLENHGVQVISIGFLVDKDEAMIWRGPMATQALDQLLRQTNWKELDYLLVDMPPGTGDIQLTLSQRVPMTGAVIVTTPQDIALLDARKGVKMFEKVGVPILGLVENMAVYCCPNCGHTEHIFGRDGGKHMAAEYGMDYLGALPLNMQIRVQADSGTPTVVADPDGEVAGIYKAVARKVAITVAAKAKDFSNKFPTIKISKDT